MDLKIYNSCDFQTVLLGCGEITMRTPCRARAAAEFGAADWGSLHNTVIPHSE